MFEDLSSAKQICIDLETRDDDLRERGCGAQRGGYILGIAVATDTGIKEYYPLRHPDSDNCNEQQVLDYFKRELFRPNQHKIGTNIIYDLEYLAVAGVHVKGRVLDVSIAEPLIDENQFKYSLDRMAQKYLGETKKLGLIEDKCKELGYKGDPRAHLWKLPASLVRDYAISDVDLPLRIFKHQREIIKSEGLRQVFMLESRLTPLLLQMRLTGCPVDVSGASALLDELVYEQGKLKQRLSSVGIYPGTTDDARTKMAAYLTERGIEVPLTEGTKKPSITKPFLKGLKQDEIQELVRYNEQEKIIKTFLQSQILGSLHNGRIYSSYNQVKSERGGTETGRFSSSNPNMQNIPARTELGQRCRALFIPEEGHQFNSIDYSQIEYRLLCHFALGRGAEEMREAFIADPNIDIHTWCASTVNISRTQAKGINFGLIYGQGLPRTAEELQLSIEDAKVFLDAFDTKMPFIKYTAREAQKRAQHRGYIKTLLGRRRRFNSFEMDKYKYTNGMTPKDKAEFLEKYKDEKILSYEEAKIKWTHLKRAGTHKSLNSVIQGSAADLQKLAMVTAFEAGIFNTLVPLSTVHDELNNSVPPTKEGEEAVKALVNIMENCYNFKIPIKTSCGFGANWDAAKSHA